MLAPPILQGLGQALGRKAVPCEAGELSRWLVLDLLSSALLALERQPAVSAGWDQPWC